MPPPFPWSEMEEMVERWKDANALAEEEGNWAKHLGQFYTDDTVYTWNMGPNQEFRATGRQEIYDIALGYHMKGFEKLRYPFTDFVIDDQRGAVVAFYRQIAPATRSDSTLFEVAGTSGSKFEYGGNYKWKTQIDFFDLGNVKNLFFEMAGEGVIEHVVRQKIHEQAQGALLPGIGRLRNESSMCTKISNIFAMIKIALVG